MAGLTSSLASLFKNPPRLSQSHKPLPLQSLTFHVRLRTATWPSASSAKSTVSASYGGGVSSRRSKTNDDEALNIASIGSSTVRLIDAQQRMVGLVSKAQALQMADDAELDLVILSPEADPPVVRIMDYSKYKYEQQKKKRDQQKKSAAGRMDLKELKMGYNIDVHDYTVRLKAAQKFLKDGDKVKVVVSLKGRENEFRNNAIELIKRFQNDVGESAIEESKSFRERNIFIILVPNKANAQIPNKANAQKSQEPPKKKDDTAVTEFPAGV